MDEDVKDESVPGQEMYQFDDYELDRVVFMFMRRLPIHIWVPVKMIVKNLGLGDEYTEDMILASVERLVNDGIVRRAYNNANNATSLVFQLRRWSGDRQ